MYNLNKFNKLPNREKLALVEEQGTYLELIRKDSHLKIRLFSLFQFYVEIYFSEGRVQLVTAIGINDQKLDQYLSTIDLTEIYAVL